MAELVNIVPKRDVVPTRRLPERLKRSLDDVFARCIDAVGIEVDMAILQLQGECASGDKKQPVAQRRLE